jgi:hypothetical protein
MTIASGRPLTNAGRIIRCAKNEFRSTIVPRADVANIGFASHEDLCTTEIAKFENTSLRVQEKILGLNVAVTNADRMNIGERAEELIHIKLDLKNGHGLFKLYVVSTGAIDRLRDEFKNEIEVDFVFLLAGVIIGRSNDRELNRHTLSPLE